MFYADFRKEGGTSAYANTCERLKVYIQVEKLQVEKLLVVKLQVEKLQVEKLQVEKLQKSIHTGLLGPLLSKVLSKPV
jgi:hypothetical protein